MSGSEPGPAGRGGVPAAKGDPGEHLVPHRSPVERIRSRLPHAPDWLETGLAVLGVLFFALSVLSVVVVVVLAVHFGEETTGLPVGSSFLKGARGVGIALFALLAIVSFFVGRAFVGDRIARAFRRRR